MLFKKGVLSMFIMGIFFFSLGPQAILAGQSAKEGFYMKVAFYAFDKETGRRGEFLGFAELKEEKLNIDITDPRLKTLLECDFVTTGGKTEEITGSDGKKILKGGLIIYKSGTTEHLHAIVERARDMGYMGEIVVDN